ncbi:Superfamily II DNA and RNA helicase [Cnuella takakiae]|uniref:Superfamily II DNA and RNA helicase n=1 Tax=Cnuella takakiae TaxID=1302690 RepID=A0A1M5GBY8_9BACT|nr:DEAD/DEAH box helicase [Cnuella takakiae]OLY94781.1 helicase [Cnuella takakiae]SHG01267.1 Superfamily II DNA and RNA helicase [Cnuella takakiae]
MNQQLKDALLANLKIKELNEMQQATLEAARDHANMVLLSATGSGKTLAFLIPVLESLDKTIKGTQALIIVPSRELALQIEDVFRKMATGFKVTTCYGGHKREIEENNLLEAPALIIGTPGRLTDHIRRENITTQTIRTLVLDEFDKSLELGFLDELSFIVGALPAVERRMLTSATEAIEIPEFLGLTDVHRLDFLPTNEEQGPRLELYYVNSEEKDKADTLFQFICTTAGRSTIVFCNHRESVERLNQMLQERGLTTTFYHGSMEQREREVALAKFRNGSINTLITTDLAARGLDIPHIRYIVHYHLPATEETFTHRNGRTARMEASGAAVLLLGPGERLPAYLQGTATEMTVDPEATLPEKPKWTTLFIAAGKKDKVNKVDIVGFFAQKGDLKKEDIGVIEVKDFFSFVALRRSQVSHVLHLIKDLKIKGKKVKIAVAK